MFPLQHEWRRCMEWNAHESGMADEVCTFADRQGLHAAMCETSGAACSCDMAPTEFTYASWRDKAHNMDSNAMNVTHLQFLIMNMGAGGALRVLCGGARRRGAEERAALDQNRNPRPWR